MVRVPLRGEPGPLRVLKPSQQLLGRLNCAGRKGSAGATAALVLLIAVDVGFAHLLANPLGPTVRVPQKLCEVSCFVRGASHAGFKVDSLKPERGLFAFDYGLADIDARLRE